MTRHLNKHSHKPKHISVGSLESYTHNTFVSRGMWACKPHRSYTISPLFYKHRVAFHTVFTCLMQECTNVCESTSTHNPSFRAHSDGSHQTNPSILLCCECNTRVMLHCIWCITFHTIQFSLCVWAAHDVIVNIDKSNATVHYHHVTSVMLHIHPPIIREIRNKTFVYCTHTDYWQKIQIWERDYKY